MAWLIALWIVEGISLVALTARAGMFVQERATRERVVRRPPAAQVRAEVWQRAQAARVRVAPGKVRVTDAERDAAIAELARAREFGALDAPELDDRMSHALESKTREDLTRLLADLPWGTK